VRFAVAAPGRDVPTGLTGAVLDTGGDLRHEPIDRSPPGPAQLAMVTFTSGTTGRPKAVGVEHRNLAAYAEAAGTLLGAGPAMGLASPAAPSVDLGLTAWLVGLRHGGPVTLLTPETVRDPYALADALEAAAPDVLKITPSHLDALLTVAGPRVLPRHTLILGGEQLPAGLTGRIHALAPALRVVNHYGPTETTVGALAHVVDPAAGDTGVPIGRALAGAIALPGGPGPVPSGDRRAELWIAGAGVTRGYLGDPRLTADRFRPDPGGGSPGGRAYRTGDLVRLASGAAVFAGRSDRQTKVRGVRVELGEVERELRAQPGVEQAVAEVTGQSSTGRLDAWVVAPGADPAAVLAGLREVLPDAMIPSRLTLVDAIPLTPGGKVDHDALRALIATARAGGRGPRGPAEEAVAAVFADVLGAPVTDAEASFFELGGHSLLATLAIARLRDSLGCAVDVDRFFADSTVAGVAALVGPAVADRLTVAAEIAGMTDDEVARALEKFDAP
jgi:acyl-coenzyme A synthetase/AMP-(fatty) acid ligase